MKVCRLNIVSVLYAHDPTTNVCVLLLLTVDSLPLFDGVCCYSQGMECRPFGWSSSAVLAIKPAKEVFAAVDCNLVNEGSYLQFCVHAEVVVGFHMQTPLIVAFLVSSSQESGVAECSKADNVFAEVPKAVIAFCLEHGGAVRSSRIWQALTEKLPDRCLMIDC